jgi:anti-anti-sigma regulatory factor
VLTASYFDSVIGGFDATVRRMMTKPEQEELSIDWLQYTGEVWGCYAEWDPADATRQSLVVKASYARPGFERIPLGLECRATAFPPTAWLPPTLIDQRRFIKILQVRTDTHNWGLLALCGIFEPQVYTTSLAHLLGSVRDQQSLFQSIQAQQQELQLAFEREHILSETVRELGCPIIPLLPGVLLIPLIGMLDSSRAQHLLDVALHAVAHQRAENVLLDITGVPLVDTQVAGALIHVAQSVALLGAELTLVGIRPEIAQSIVSLGLNVHMLTTYSSLAAALHDIMRHRKVGSATRP